jgi:hypothetical protein
MTDKTDQIAKMNWKFAESKKIYSYVAISFIFLLILDIIAYFLVWNQMSNFVSKYAWWILYLDISVVTLGGALWYYASHKGYVSCMASMMIGMTLGMQTGMMLGAVFGAVNGYFIGAMIGMLSGTIVGFITGRASIMGALQGMMSGLMGGTMGAMITVMMFTDHVLLFMPFYMLINVAILIGFLYMYHDEVIKDNKEVVKKHISFGTFAFWCIVTTIILSAVMIYAPKSVWFG